MINNLDQIKKQRHQQLQNDQMALQQAQMALPNQTTIDRLNNDLEVIKQAQTPKLEQLREIKAKEPEVDYRQQAVEEMSQKLNTQVEPTTENVKQAVDQAETGQNPISAPEISTTDNQPESEIIPQIGLSPIVLQKAKQAAQEASVTAEPKETISDTYGQVDTSTSFQSNYPDGYQFSPGASGLGGQCAWYAEQITTLPNGKNWTIGSTVAEKKQQLQGHIQNGNGFALGDGVPQVGNSIVFNGGKWGHVAVISKINEDGTAVLDESNYGNDRKVTKSRTVRLDDPSILGFLSTIPR
jgi:surface antigen